MNAFFYPSKRGINFAKIRGFKVTDYSTLGCCSDRRKSVSPSAPIAYATSVSPPDEAVAWPGAAFLQITARANPCSRHLWGTLARAVASI